jgi:hypothetical protein
MAARASQYRAALESASDVEAYLKSHSGLPGPRANLELVRAAGDVTAKQQLLRWSHSDDEFLALCGAAGLGRFAQEDAKVLPRLKVLASDPRWRVREGVAIALQRIGDDDMDALIRAVIPWARDPDLFVRRAAIAGVCEPRLLKNPKHAMQALVLLDQVVTSMPPADNRKSEAFRVLRQTLGYCASVAASASPGLGGRMMERWVGSHDPDLRWIVKSNLGKARMVALGREWLESNRRGVEA